MMKAIIFFVYFYTSVAGAIVCQKYSSPQNIGELNSNFLTESSGIEVSNNHDVLYHTNDSGDGPYIYVSNLTGQATSRIEVSGLNPRDVEDLTLGSCGQEDCLYIGDIGDNNKVRRSITITVITESELLTKNIANPILQFDLVYPNGPHNAEALAVHPNGDLYVLTKEKGKKGTNSKPSILYRAPANQIGLHSTIQLEEVAVFDFSKLYSARSADDHTVTSMDIDDSGNKLIVLTYSGLFEANIDLSTLNRSIPINWNFGVNYNYFPQLNYFPQQEAIAFVDNGSGFIYTTESKSNSPIVGHFCEK